MREPVALPGSGSEPDAPASCLDALDREILRVMTAQGRVPLSRVAAAVGVRRTEIAARVRRLERRGVITGFHAALDHGVLGRPWQALVAVRLAPATTGALFEASLREEPAALRAWRTAADADYEVLLACRDLADLDAVTRGMRTAGAERTTTRLVLREVERLDAGPWENPATS